MATDTRYRRVVLERERSEGQANTNLFSSCSSVAAAAVRFAAFAFSFNEFEARGSIFFCYKFVVLSPRVSNVLHCVGV